MSRIIKAFTSYHPVIWLLWFGTAITYGAFFMTFPFFSIYLTKEMGISPFVVGIILGIGPLTSTLGGLVGGFLADRYGRKRIMLVSLLLTSFVFFGFGLANHAIIFMLLCGLQGFFRSLFEPSSQAILTEYSTEDKRSKIFSYRYLAINLGGVVGPVIGVTFLTSSPHTGFFITGAIYFLYFIFLFFVLSKLSVTNQDSGKGKGKVSLKAMNHVLKSDIPLRYFIMGGILVQFIFCQATSTLPQFLEKSIEDGALLYSYLLMISSLLVILLQMPVSWLVEKFTPQQSVTGGCLFFAASYAGFAYFDGWTGLIFAIVLFTIGEMIVIPSSSVFVDKLAAGEWKATYFGAFQLRFLGTFAGQSIGGALLMGIGGPGLFASLVVIAILTPLIFIKGTNTTSVKVALSK